MAIFGPWEQPIFEGWSVLCRARPADLADPARADGRGQHVPQPGPHRQARDDARPPLGRSGGARHRRRLVRARARRLRHRVLLGPRGAARPARRVGDADAPAARRRAVQPRGPVLHVRTTRSCEPRPVQAHLPILVGGSGPKKTLRTVALRADAWNTTGTRRGGRGPSSTSSPSTAPTSGATSRTIEKTLSFPIILRDDRAAAEAVLRRAAGAQRDRGHGRRRSCSEPRPRWPTRYGRTSSWASRPSSSGCPRRTTARRSTGWPRSASSSTDDARA